MSVVAVLLVCGLAAVPAVRVRVSSSLGAVFGAETSLAAIQAPETFIQQARRLSARGRRTEAEALANGTDYGLYDYIWSGDVTRAVNLAARLRTGNVGINTLQRNHEAAFGGFKYSGIGRDGGSWGLHAYSEMQSITWKG